MTSDPSKPKWIPWAERYGPPLPPEMIEELAKHWYQENKEAVDEYNEDVRKHGVLTESLRTF